jgi:hypothetical protein
VGLLVGLAAIGCSGAGQSRARTPEPVSTTSVPAGYLVAALGPCPKHGSAPSLAVLNHGVVGLGKKLVPIDAVKLRICEYDSRWVDGSHPVPGRLVASALLKPAATRQFEAETNRQPATNPGPLGCTGPGGGVLFGALTFANDSQRVSLTLQIGSCGAPILSNGYDVAYPASAWTIDLFRLADRTKRS